jgi:ABC-type nitrate/sulfonate/bicarbonate transport system permease component
MSELDTPLLARPIGGGIRFDLAAAAIGRRAGAIVPLLALVVAWETASRSGVVTPFLLPPISAVLERVWQDAISGELAVNLGLTLFRSLVGFAIAGAGGVVLGILMTRRRLIRWFFDPIVSVGFPMPKIAFLPIFMLWLGLYDVSKISMAVFNAIFPVITAPRGWTASSCGRHAASAPASGNCCARSSCRRRCRRS